MGVGNVLPARLHTLPMRVQYIQHASSMLSTHPAAGPDPAGTVGLPPTCQDGVHARVPHLHQPPKALQLVFAQGGRQAGCKVVVQGATTGAGLAEWWQAARHVGSTQQCRRQSWQHSCDTAAPGCTSTGGGAGGKPAARASAALLRMAAATSAVMKGRSTCSRWGRETGTAVVGRCKTVGENLGQAFHYPQQHCCGCRNRCSNPSPT